MRKTRYDPYPFCSDSDIKNHSAFKCKILQLLFFHPRAIKWFERKRFLRIDRFGNSNFSCIIIANSHLDFYWGYVAHLLEDFIPKVLIFIVLNFYAAYKPKVKNSFCTHLIRSDQLNPLYWIRPPRSPSSIHYDPRFDHSK